MNAQQLRLAAQRATDQHLNAIQGYITGNGTDKEIREYTRNELIKLANRLAILAVDLWNYDAPHYAEAETLS